MRPPRKPLRSTVIIVEDDPSVLGSLKFALEVGGWDVRAHATPEALLQAGALPKRSCLVVDYRLPGMNGLDLVRRLRAAGARLPAVLMTTSNRALQGEAARAGVPILEKPIELDQLQRTLRAMLGSKSLAAAA